jgi:glycosyltransferase involved in cell wall biosynthesis
VRTSPEPSLRPGLPSVSVVIRSHRRLDSLLRLLEAVLRQDYPDFEVIVVEQSEASALERAPLDALVAQDARLRVIYSKPLGSGGARNAGWRAARNEIVLLIDDDDVPLGDGFIRGHVTNYADPDIVAVTGRHVYSVGERCGYRNRQRARRLCLRYNAFGYPHAFCRFDERIESVDWVHGTNASVRRAVIERVGGWDGTATAHDEHAFCQQLLRQLRPGERLVFDPSVVLLRSKDVSGGAGLRWSGPRIIFDNWLHYFHAVAARYHSRWRKGYYLLVPLVCWFLSLRWVWVDAKMYTSIGVRMAASLRVLVSGPFWYLRPIGRSVSLASRGLGARG